MNKKAKLLLVLLSAATVTAAGAMGLAGCNKGDDTSDMSKTENVYNSYVAYAEENGQTVLSYEDWLKAVQSKLVINGKDGVDGKTPTIGENGNWHIGDEDTGTKAEGEKGEDGVGINRIEYDQENGVLHVEYSDGNTDDVELPETITHVHKYIKDMTGVSILIAPTPTSDGLGYMTCTEDGCEHFELVVINRNYTVLVKKEGRPFANANVVINGERATTNENGVAEIFRLSVGDLNDYIVSVDEEGYISTQVARTGSGFETDIEISLNKAFDTVVVKGEYGDDMYYDFNGVGIYTLPVATNPYGGVTPAYIRIKNNTDEIKKYIVATDDPCFDLRDNDTYDNYVSEEDTSGEIVIMPGDTVVAILNVNMMTVMQKVNAGEMAWGDNYYLTLKFEEGEPPLMGTESLPYEVTEDTPVTLPEGRDEWVYYTWKNSSVYVKELQFDLTNVDVEFKFYNYKEEQKWDPNWNEYFTEYSVTEDEDWTTISESGKKDLVHGAGIENGLIGGSDYCKTYKFRVKRKASGTAGFTLTTLTPYGLFEKPATSTLGQTKFDCSKDSWTTSKWTVLTVETAGDYTFIKDKCDSIKIYNSKPANEWVDADTEIYSAKGIVHLAAGTHYIVCQSTSDGGNLVCEFTVRATDATADAGVSAKLAKDVTAESSYNSTDGTFTAENGTYYKYTVPAGDGGDKEGTLTLTASKSNDNLLNIAYVGTESTVDKSYKSSIECKTGDVIYIKTSGDEDTFTVTLNWADKGEPAKIEHTFTVKDEKGAPLKGVTVKVMNDDSVLASEETGEDGTVKLSFVPGKYKVKLEGGAAETYYYEDEGQTSTTKTEYTLKLRSAADKSTYKFTVACGAKKFAGAKVTLTSGNLVVSGTTSDGTDDPDNEGTVTLSIYFPTVGGSAITYKVELAEADKENYSLPSGIYEIKAASTSEVASVPVAVVEAVEYSVTLVDENGDSVQGVTAILNSGNNEVTRGTTDQNGAVSFKVAPEEYTVTFADCASGYCVANIKLTAENLTATALYMQGNAIATGASNANRTDDKNRVVLGDTVVANSGAVGYYMYSVTTSGRYTFTVKDAAEKGFITYLGTQPKGWEPATVYINNGKEINVEGNLVLNKARAFNKTYNLSLDLKAGTVIIIGYDTGTGTAGGAKIGVSATNLVPALHKDSNPVALTSGKATLEYANSSSGELVLTWTDSTVTVKIDGNAYTSGTTLEIEDGVHTVEVTSTNASLSSVTINLAFTENRGPGGYPGM